MMVLLPLRGWAGDVMGVQMATNHAATQAQAQAAPSAAALMPGCPMHPQAATPDGSPSDPHTANCTACDLCTPMAELPSAAHPLVVHGTDTQPRMLTASFVSAALAPTVKPPIF